MELSKIAKFMEYLDIALGVIWVVFGVTVVCIKKWRKNVLLSGSCVAVFAALILEATVFNYPFYLRYSSDPAISIKSVLKIDQNIAILTDSTHVEIFRKAMRFSNFNMKITSVFVDADFINIETETVKMSINYTKDGIKREYTKRLYKYMPRENYALPHIRGKVSEFLITFHVPESSSLDIRDIVINKPVPFYFNGLRFFIVSLLLFMLFSLVNKNLRASYWPR
jgi:hypothetical protein